MKVPNAQCAVITEDKLRNYLLNIAHRRGGSKAKLLLVMGYDPQTWQTLEKDLREQHLTQEVATQSASDYGARFEIVAPLTGPRQKAVLFRSIWQIDVGTDYPRLITMYPE